MIYYIPVPQITILNFQTNKTTLIKTKISKKKKEKKNIIRKHPGTHLILIISRE